MIFDEPFSGLDPVNAQIFQEAILDEQKKGKCIIFSSHNMDNVEELSEHIVMLKNGEIVLNGTVHDIRNSFGRIKVFLESKLTIDDLKQIDGIDKIEEKAGRFILTLSDPKVGHDILARAEKLGFFDEFSQQPMSLDEIFKLKAREK